MPVDKNIKLFADYISQRKIVIADGGAAARAGLAKTLVGLGAKMNFIRLAGTFQDAVSEIEKHKPHIILCDYDLGNDCGLNLIQHQRENNKDSKNSLFVLVTANTSQSAVATAAEEDVDTFVLKPYTVEVLRSTIMKAALAKVYPSDYHKRIEEGKEQLFAGKPEEAKSIFESAMTLDPKPSLACFYVGQADLLKEAMEEAQGKFQQGLNYNKIHFKCMTGLYDLLMKKKAYPEAYQLVKKISRYFPANPQRLTSVLRLAVMTQSFGDIERYYQVFTGIDNRNDELIRYVCAALIVCGKFYLQRKFPSRALELYKKAAITSAGKPRVLREIISDLVNGGQVREAEEFLKKFPPQTQNGGDFFAMDLLIMDKSSSTSAVIERARDIMKKDIHDPLVYQILIRRSVEAGYTDGAEDLVQKAEKRWPEKKGLFKVEGPDKSA